MDTDVRSDVSFMHEAVVELLPRHRPPLGFVAVYVAEPDVRSNLEAALDARGERLLMGRREQDTTHVLGKPLTAEYLQILKYAEDAREITSAVSTQQPFGLGASTDSARLATLWKARLLMRHPAVAISRGKE